MCVRVCTTFLWGQYRALDPLVLELQTVVSHPIWGPNLGDLEEQ